MPVLTGPPALAQDNFTWSHNDTTIHFTYGPRDISTASGPGDYQVNLLYDGQVAAIHKFRIEK